MTPAGTACASAGGYPWPIVSPPPPPRLQSQCASFALMARRAVQGERGRRAQAGDSVGSGRGVGGAHGCVSRWARMAGRAGQDTVPEIHGPSAGCPGSWTDAVGIRDTWCVGCTTGPKGYGMAHAPPVPCVLCASSPYDRRHPDALTPPGPSIEHERGRRSEGGRKGERDGRSDVHHFGWCDQSPHGLLTQVLAWEPPSFLEEGCKGLCRPTPRPTPLCS